MIEASKHLIGVHDFTSFSKGIPDSPVREVKKIEFEQKEDLIEIVFEGKSFLRHMVRIMVAVLVEVGKGNLEPEDVLEIREARDRKKAPFLAPPDGLYLVKVHY
jgi:tRNA pseudouridine38-40 synthase